MSAAAGDEPAFPVDFETSYRGLTVRAYFAVQAMRAMCGGSPWPDRQDGPEIARRAVLMADDLIAALNTPPERDTHEPFR